MKVQVSKKILDSFRRRALKRYPKEIMETVFGRVVDDTVQIFAFYPIDHTASTEACEYYPIDLEEQREKEDAPEYPHIKFLGTIHSHPDGGPDPSDSDWETARTDGDIVSGIYQILPSRKGRKKCKVRFYSEPMQPLELV